MTKIKYDDISKYVTKINNIVDERKQFFEKMDIQTNKITGDTSLFTGDAFKKAKNVFNIYSDINKLFIIFCSNFQETNAKMISQLNGVMQGFTVIDVEKDRTTFTDLKNSYIAEQNIEIYSLDENGELEVNHKDNSKLIAECDKNLQIIDNVEKFDNNIYDLYDNLISKIECISKKADFIKNINFDVSSNDFEDVSLNDYEKITDSSSSNKSESIDFGSASSVTVGAAVDGVITGYISAYNAINGKDEVHLNQSVVNSENGTVVEGFYYYDENGVLHGSRNNGESLESFVSDLKDQGFNNVTIDDIGVLIGNKNKADGTGDHQAYVKVDQLIDYNNSNLSESVDIDNDISSEDNSNNVSIDDQNNSEISENEKSNDIDNNKNKIYAENQGGPQPTDNSNKTYAEGNNSTVSPISYSNDFVDSNKSQSINLNEKEEPIDTTTLIEKTDECLRNGDFPGFISNYSKELKNRLNNIIDGDTTSVGPISEQDYYEKRMHDLLFDPTSYPKDLYDSIMNSKAHRSALKDISEEEFSNIINDIRNK